MKALGTLLLLLGGLWVRHSVLSRHREHIQMGEELLEALQILERGVYTLRRPLGELIEQCRAALERLYTCRDNLDFAKKNAVPEQAGG